ncbi:MAG: RNA polymerase sigma factor [Methylacidiphilales bacterium]|nr:RNA polymerase sigma factor [Candidatus Methylacidiphilales bacterium]
MNPDPSNNVQNTGAGSHDESWLPGAREGREEAWAEIHRHYYKGLWSAVNQILHDETLSEDVVQEAFLKAYRQIRRFEGHSRFSTWLYRIALNQAYDVLRKTKRRSKYLGLFPVQEEDETVPLEAIDPHTPIDDVERADHQLALSKALATLAPEHRAVVELRLVQGFSTDETAQILKCRRGTVLSRLFYSCQRLKKVLEKYRHEL